MHKLLLTSFAATACLLVACSREQPAEAPAADWVLTNGQIYTVDDTRPWAEAMVVKDGKFIYVGDSAGAESFISETVKTTDLGGGMVIPGIVDAHTHPGFIELEQYDLTLDNTDREDFLAELKAFADDNPGDDWLRVWCWPNRAFVDGAKGPDRTDLDGE